MNFIEIKEILEEANEIFERMRRELCNNLAKSRVLS